MTPEPRRAGLGALVLVPGVAAGLLAWAAVIGLGVTRRGDAAAVAMSATALVFGPAILVGAANPRGRLRRVGWVLLVWSAGIVLSLPVYFPGERRDALATGLAVLTGPEGDHMARSVAGVLPDEPELAVAQVPPAAEVTPDPLPPPPPIGENEIALAYHGEGRRLSVPVVFEHRGRTVEVDMMLDTGATYTTLPLDVLAGLGVFPGPDAPELTLHTANGERVAQVVLLERVWLGDLALDGVAITTCEDCASESNAGLLGLNVTGAYNLNIDADRHEVVFSRRARFNRRLDVRPFSDLQARFVRYPGGRIEVDVAFDNRSPRPLDGAAARVTCGASSWDIDLGPVAARASTDARRRLPQHPACDTYQIVLEEAWW